MPTPPSLLDLLRKAVEESPLTKLELAKRAGMSRKTLFLILEGTTDYRISSVLALVDALELEVQLVPKLVREHKLGGASTSEHSKHSPIGAFLRLTKDSGSKAAG
ncbi:helix-turn-helix transcriptional regulator [Nostoc sp. CHAB 5834]|nr:helix-turn-helix transcriptional regulator [Nostoc sp. CHAB 5834]